MADTKPQLISRRSLLRSAGAVGAAAAVGAKGSPAATASSHESQLTPTGEQTSDNKQPRYIFEQLTADEAELLEAIADQLIPEDDLGPGAVAAGAVTYIDRALGGALSESRDAYHSGLAAFDRYCRSSRDAPFLELSHIDQVSVLIDVETGAATGASTGFTGSSSSFFSMLRSHVLQGTFGDPFYGGNQNFVGWDLIRYPGVRTSVWPRLQTQLEAGELSPNHRSAYDSEYFEKAVVRTATKGTYHGD
ncbi:MAG: hypothetical protein CL484_09010 [Acidobacteria bacterium]|nr:hypothetical protein [Acidobacteriota bacterium]